MANKTPGEVAWEAYRSALVETPDQPATGGYTSPAWEAAAQAVRQQVAEQIKLAGSMEDRGAEAISRLGALQRLLARWDAKDFGPNYDDAFGELVKVVEPFFPASPKPEESKDDE